MQWISRNTEEHMALAENILDLCRNTRLFLFKGELGAGKTSLIKGFVNQLGGEELVSSPSFSLVNEYNTFFGKVYHLDLYRLKDEKELEDIGIDDYLSENPWMFIEWPEIGMSYFNYLPHGLVEIEYISASERKVQLQCYSEL